MDINTQAVTPPKQILGNSLLGREEGYESTVKGRCYNELQYCCYAPKQSKSICSTQFSHLFFIEFSFPKENCRCTETERDPYEDLVVDHQRLKL